jgi:DNA-binding winged helix-turn-helix (wHTH) protein
VNAASFPVRVAGLSIDPVRRRVSGPGGEAVMEPLVAQLLMLFVARKSEVLSRRELFEHLWGKAQVGDDSLNRLVAGVRKALDRTSDGSVQIETVPRVGYRLIAEREYADVARPITRRSVIAVSASLFLTAAGAGVWKTRHNARAAEAQHWIERGDILLRDAVPIEAGDALPPLRSALLIDPNNPTALGLLALAEETRAMNGASANAGDILRIAEKSARAALQENPREPHARLAMIDMAAGSLDWAQFEDQLLHLHRSAPLNFHVLGSLTSFFEAAGRTSKSWLYNEQAAATAPSSPTPQWRRALRLWTAGRDNEALKLSERLLPLWPRHALVWNTRFMILAFTGRPGAAAAMLRPGAGPSANSHPVRLDQWLPTLDALADPSTKRIAKAREANLAAAQLNPGQATYAAMALSQLGEIDAAYLVINALLLSKGPLVANRPVVPRSFIANSPSWCRTQWLFMPPLAPVRADPRFGALCEELGLVRYWKQRGVDPDTRLAS